MTRKVKVKPKLKSFSILGLFGSRNIIIPFDSGVKILIGENGLGKTSMLNALYYTLTGKFTNLSSIVFDKIILEFNDSKELFEIASKELALEDKKRFRRDPRLYDIEIALERFLSREKYQKLINEIKNKNISYVREIIHEYSQAGIISPYPSGYIVDHLMSRFSETSGKLEKTRVKIKELITEDILYFPTYRRIEEELHKLGTGEIKLTKDDKRLIQFGMEDVKETFDTIIKRINSSFINGYSEITGEMLSQYVDGIPEIEPQIKDRILPDILTIILERVGENISPDYKTRILDLVKTGTIFEERYRYLVNFLSKLIKIYDQQKTLDNNIKTFERVCNGYLIGKRVYYNESKVQIKVVQEKNDEPIELKNLSSGEKQIISLFAKIYLEDHKELIVLFDEPELSLSIEWQEKLLPDILSSKKASIILAVTHSPFIFDNDLKLFAEDMNKYVKAI